MHTSPFTHVNKPTPPSLLKKCPNIGRIFSVVTSFQHNIIINMKLRTINKLYPSNSKTSMEHTISNCYKLVCWVSITMKLRLFLAAGS